MTPARLGAWARALRSVAVGGFLALAQPGSAAEPDVPSLPVPASSLRSAPVVAHSPETWIAHGAQVHGGFGVLIAVGIRIGLDALERLGVARRELDVTYFAGPGAPCPCVVDGILVATSASPGQGSLRVGARPAGLGWHGEALIRRRRDGAGLRYCIKETAVAELEPAQRSGDAMIRWQAVMTMPLDRLVRVVEAQQPCGPADGPPATGRQP